MIVVAVEAEFIPKNIAIAATVAPTAGLFLTKLEKALNTLNFLISLVFMTKIRIKFIADNLNTLRL